MNKTSYKAEQRLSAIAVSRGLGIGPVEFLQNPEISSLKVQLDASAIECEVSRFQNAVSGARIRLDSLARSAVASPSEKVSGIFDVHLLILESSFVDKVEAVIRQENVNAEWAIAEVSDSYTRRQKNVSEAHIREKELDMRDVADRLQNELGSSRPTPRLQTGGVIVARDLQPSTLIELAKYRPAGIVTERGGWTSHTSILAREFKIPMVSGVKLSPVDVTAGDELAVDGNNGQVIVSPSAETLHELREILADTSLYDDHTATNEAVTATLDGAVIAVRANVELIDAYRLAKDSGAQGIGLYRSESLISESGGLPTEDDQVHAYTQIAMAAGDFCVNIRTFDIGPETLGSSYAAPARNPSLGLRSIRLSLSEPAAFRTQIRAILRANVSGNIGILLPMISSVSEVRRSKAIISEELGKLIQNGVAARSPRIGAMIEVPSAVLTVREIARNVDFLCLGTNDLVQYLLAVDRDNDLAAEWYQTLHPAVLRAIREVSAAGRDCGIPVIACGEMAGSAFYVPLLLGLGIRELSMTLNSIRAVRRLIAGITVENAISLVDRSGSCETSADVEHLLRTYYVENWNDLFPPGLLNSTHR